VMSALPPKADIASVRLPAARFSAVTNRYRYRH
jgi:hypothetical protein